jgi:hypothetical protein
MDLAAPGHPSHRFYTAMGLAVSLIVLLGFGRTYFFRAWFDVPPLTVWLHLHGLSQTLWLALFLVQGCLIARGRRRLHQSLGFAGIGLAAFAVVTTYAAAIESAHVNSARGGISQIDRLYSSVVILGLFLVFVTAGIALRRNREVHKRWMLLATITVVGPGASRAVSLLAGHGVRDGHVAVMGGLVLASWIHDWRTRKRPHWVLVVGGVILLFSQLSRRLVGASELWGSIGRWLIG